MSEEEILTQLIAFIKNIKIEREKFYEPALRKNRNEIHFPFINNIRDFLKKEGLEVIREYKVYDRNDVEHRADIVVKDTTGQILFHIEADSGDFEQTVPFKFDNIPSKYKIWIQLPDRKKVEYQKKRFAFNVNSLKSHLLTQPQNLICVLKSPDAFEISDKT